MTLILPLPPSINATYKRGRNSFYKDAVAKEWENTAYYMIKNNWREKKLLGHVLLTVCWYFKDARRDISSGIKILEDILQTAGVYENDRQIHHEIITKFIDAKNPRVEVRVEEI